MCDVSLCITTAGDMAHIDRMKSEISSLEEIGMETVSSADIVIVMKNGLRKEEKALLEVVAFPFQKYASAPQLSLGTWDFTTRKESICGRWSLNDKVDKWVSSLQKLQL